MSRIYDDWERLVAAVLRRELIWEICHDHSRTDSSDFSSVLRSNSLFSSLSSEPIDSKNGYFKSDLSLPFQDAAEFKISVKPGTNELEPDELVFFEGSPFAFGLRELLAAPCFVLGDELETFRNTYVVKLSENVVFVAKRLRSTVTRVRLDTVGGIEHENVVKLRGYYLSNDVSFGFYDNYPQGSIHAMLHGGRMRSPGTSEKND